MGNMVDMDEKGLPKKGSIGRPKRSEAGAKQIELMERRKRVAELHTQGLYWIAIGLELGISDTQAANDWKAWMAECREYPGREAQREFARASYESDLEAANRDIARAEAAVEAALTVTTSTTLDGKPIMVGGPESFVKVEAALDRARSRRDRALAHLRRLDGLDEPARVDVTSQGGPVVGPLDRLAGILDKE